MSSCLVSGVLRQMLAAISSRVYTIKVEHALIVCRIHFRVVGPNYLINSVVISTGSAVLLVSSPLRLFIQPFSWDIVRFDPNWSTSACSSLFRRLCCWVFDVFLYKLVCELISGCLVGAVRNDHAFKH